MKEAVRTRRQAMMASSGSRTRRTFNVREGVLRRFVTSARTAIAHRDDPRFFLLWKFSLISPMWVLFAAIVVVDAVQGSEPLLPALLMAGLCLVIAGLIGAYVAFAVGRAERGHDDLL